MSPEQMVTRWEVSGYEDNGQLISTEPFEGPLQPWAAGQDNGPAAVAVLLAFAETKTAGDFLAAHLLRERVSVSMGVRPLNRPSETPLRCRVDAQLSVNLHIYTDSTPA